VTDSPTQTLPRLGTECPTCGAHADPGQLVCLECSTRLALDYRRPRGWKAPLLVILLVLAVAGAAFAITLITVDDDSKDEVAASKAGKQAGPEPAAKKPAKNSPRPASGGIVSWPSGRNGFTVVLLAAGDRASARKFATNARRGGAEVGVLRSDDFSSLEKGFWLVFSGVYRSQGQAQRASARLGRRFSGAYAQYVNGAKKG
jgi:septal ring-binding cell division protein DamX